MHRLVAGVSLILIALVALGIAIPLNAAKVGIGILVDMSHGQTVGGLVEMMRMIPEGNWVVLLSSQEAAATLPDYVKSNAELRYGGFTSTSLKDVDIVIIGQALNLLSPAELKALVEWFNGGTPRAIWVAGDSDYPAQGNEIAQQVINMVAEGIGARLRIDYLSVDDSLSNAKATYRVVGIVDPDPEVAELGYGVSKALFHGPGPLAAVLDDGTWVNPVKVKVPNVYVVARTSEGGNIYENQPSAPGAPGMLHQFYEPGDTGMFPLLAVEVLPSGNRFVVSGESPYGGYQSGLTYVYYGVVMQGMRLFRNVVLWATQYYGELLAYKELLNSRKEISGLASRAEELGSRLNTLTSQMSSLSGRVGTLESTVGTQGNQLSTLNNRVGTLDNTLNTLNSKVGALESTVGTLNSKVNTLESTASAQGNQLNSVSSKVSGLESRVTGLENVTGNITTSLVLGGVALVLSLAAIALALTKKK
ncbi:MAG: hypothetical protein QW705_01170 [Zestosphaera sp.]